MANQQSKSICRGLLRAGYDRMEKGCWHWEYSMGVSFYVIICVILTIFFCFCVTATIKVRSQPVRRTGGNHHWLIGHPVYYGFQERIWESTRVSGLALPSWAFCVVDEYTSVKKPICKSYTNLFSCAWFCCKLINYVMVLLVAGLQSTWTSTRIMTQVCLRLLSGNFQFAIAQNGYSNFELPT